MLGSQDDQHEQWGRALDRARRRGVRVTGRGVRRRDGARVYTVISGSSSGTWHLVVVAGKRLVCDCTASRFGRICVHRAVVHERIVTEQQAEQGRTFDRPEGSDAV